MGFTATRQSQSVGLLVALATGLGLLGAAHAADIKGSADYPLVGRYEGAEIAGYTVTDFDEVTILDGPFDPADVSKRAGPGVENRRNIYWEQIA